MLLPRRCFRRLALYGALILLLVGGGWYVWSLTKHADANLARDNIRQIKPGMSFAEVQGVVGAPPRFFAKEQEATERVSRWVTAHGWVSDDAELTVLFDDEGKVVGRRYYPPPDHPVQGLDRLKNQAKYQWRLFWQ